MDYQTANVKVESFIWNSSYVTFVPACNLKDR